MEKLGLKGHVGTDTAWIYDGAISAKRADKQLVKAGWDGEKPLIGIAVINPFCWPGMIVGHSETGYVKNFNTIYYVLKMLLTGKMSSYFTAVFLRGPGL